MCLSSSMPKMEALPAAPVEPEYAKYSKKATNTAKYYGQVSKGTNSTNVTEGKVSMTTTPGQQSNGNKYNPFALGGGGIQNQMLLGTA